MESFDHHVLLLKDSKSCVEVLVENNNCDSYLIPLMKLLKAERLGSDKKSCFVEMMKLLETDEIKLEFLRKVFEAVEKEEKFETFYELFHDFMIGDGLNEDYLRAIRFLTSMFVKDPTAEVFFKNESKRIITEIFSESSKHLHNVMIGILMQMTTSNINLAESILQTVYTNSLNKMTAISIRNLCYFFEQICDLNILPLDDSSLFKVAEKYLASDVNIAKHYFIYLAKILIYKKKLSSKVEESFKKMVIVIQDINDSKTTKKTFEMVQEMNSDDQNLAGIKLLLVICLIRDGNSEARKWGCKFLLNTLSKESDILMILQTLNSTFLYDHRDRAVDSNSLITFVTKNFDVIFKSLHEVSWKNVPLYEMLTAIESIMMLSTKVYDENFKDMLKIQSELLVRNVDNFVIRLGIQKIYSAIANRVGTMINFPSLKRVAFYEDIKIVGKLSSELQKCCKEVSENSLNLTKLSKAVNLFFKTIEERKVFATPEEIQKLSEQTNTIFNAIMNVDDNEIFKSFFDDFLYIIFLSVDCSKFDKTWMNLISKNVFEDIKKFHPLRSTQALNLFFVEMTKKPTRLLWIFRPDNDSSKFLKALMVNKIFEVNILNHEQQIETAMSDMIETYLIAQGPSLINKKIRLNCARVISDFDQNEFQMLMNEKVEEFAKLSEKNLIYSHNSHTHRFKLHFLQALVHITSINGRIHDVLVHELTKVNNQPNVLFLIEIILAHFNSNFEELLASCLKPDSKRSRLESVFMIGAMEIRQFKEPKPALEKLLEFHQLVFEFVFFGDDMKTRLSAQAAIFRAAEYVRDLLSKEKSKMFFLIMNMARSNQTCELEHDDNEVYKEICNNFRLRAPPDELFTVDAFYHAIPLGSGMPYEEVVENDRDILMLGPMDVNRPIASSTWTVSLPQQSTNECEEKLSSIAIDKKPKLTFDNECLFEFIERDFETPNADLIIIALSSSNVPDRLGFKRKCRILTDDFKQPENFELNSKLVKDFKYHRLVAIIEDFKKLGYTIVSSGKDVLNDVKMPRKTVFILHDSKFEIPDQLSALVDISSAISETSSKSSKNFRTHGAHAIRKYSENE